MIVWEIYLNAFYFKMVNVLLMASIEFWEEVWNQFVIIHKIVANVKKNI